MYVIGCRDCLGILMNEMVCFEFRSFYVAIDMRVYAGCAAWVGNLNKLRRMLGGNIVLKFCVCAFTLFGILWWTHWLCSYLLFLVSKFLAQWYLLLCCFWSSKKWVPCDVNVNVNWNQPKSKIQVHWNHCFIALHSTKTRHYCNRSSIFP